MEVFKEYVSKITVFNRRFYDVTVEIDYSQYRYDEDWPLDIKSSYHLDKDFEFLMENYGDYLVEREHFGADYVTRLYLVAP